MNISRQSTSAAATTTLLNPPRAAPRGHGRILSQRSTAQGSAASIDFAGPGFIGIVTSTGPVGANFLFTPTTTIWHSYGARAEYIPMSLDQDLAPRCPRWHHQADTGDPYEPRYPVQQTFGTYWSQFTDK